MNFVIGVVVGFALGIGFCFLPVLLGLGENAVTEQEREKVRRGETEN